VGIGALRRHRPTVKEAEQEIKEVVKAVVAEFTKVVKEVEAEGEKVKTTLMKPKPKAEPVNVTGPAAPDEPTKPVV